MKVSLIRLVLLGIGLSVCVSYVQAATDENASIAKNSENNIKVIKIWPKATTLTLVIKASPTTGFQWFVVDYDHQQLEYLGSDYIKPDSHGVQAKVGDPVKQMFKFKLRKATIKPNEVVLSLGRPWEKQLMGSKRFRIIQQH